MPERDAMTSLLHARILVVEDEPHIASLMREMLTAMGYEVVGTADHAEAAVERALEARPDVILMDVQLRGRVDGIDAARRIRAAIDIPVVFVTAYLDHELLERARQIEPFGVVAKPFEEQELQAAVVLALAKHEAFAALERRVRERTAALLASEARSRHLAAIADLGVVALREYELAPILDAAARQVAATLGTDSAGVLIVDRSGERLVLEAASGLLADGAGTLTSIEPGGHHAYVLARDTPVVVEDLAAETRFAPSPRLLAHGVVSGVYASIQTPDGPPHGIVGTSMRSRRVFTGHDVAFVHAVANLLATAIGRVAAEEARRAALAAARAAEAAVRSRDEFLSIVAHELRTPLSVVRLETEAVADVEPTPRARRLVRCVDRLVDTLETVLDLSRLTVGRLRLRREEVPLREIVAEAVDHLRDAAERAECRVSVDVPPGIVGTWDRTRIEQIVVNLLSNAFRYAPGGDVEISARTAGHEVELRVVDHGPGIPRAEQARIFERFEQASSREHFGGLGIGLYVSRQIAQAHGGTLEVESEPGAGATFVMRLPLGEPLELRQAH